MAEDADGHVVGYAWLGLDHPRTGSARDAWLYDLRVPGEHRRRGYGDAMLAAVEDLAARAAGARTLGLNVFGHNRGAIALYHNRGYEVASQQMVKPLGTDGQR